jgi:hypothetical protein
MVFSNLKNHPRTKNHLHVMHFSLDKKYFLRRNDDKQMNDAPFFTAKVVDHRELLFGNITRSGSFSNSVTMDFIN